MADGAIVKYMLGSGFVPGEHEGIDLYSTINAGAPGRYSASDAAAGGTKGDVRDKWENQMAGHRANARRWSGAGLPTISADGSISRGLDLPRAAQGLPTRPKARPEEPKEPEYADNWMGRVQKKRDTMRAGVGDKLGLDDKQMEGIGGGLQGLGKYMMQGGLG